MYPVFSVLRRLASAHIYATDAMTEVVDGDYVIRLDKPSEYLEVASARWVGPVTHAAFSRLESTSSSSAGAAISLAKRENEIAEKVRSHDIIYTMVVGPEGESSLEDGQVRRYCTYTIIRGVYRASSTVLKQQKTKGAKVQFRKPPPGTVRL